MTQIAAIENFITKVRLAQDSQCRDIRLTIKEANDLVMWIASINSQNQNDKIDQLIDSISNLINTMQNAGTSSPGWDGGAF